MKKVSLDVWIQLLGMTGIIASLIFVGLEMRQTQRIAIAGQQQARASANMDTLNAFIESGFDHQAIVWDVNFDYDLSGPEIIYRNNLHNAWHMYENDFYSYTQGLMDGSTWSAKLAGIERIYNICLGREIIILEHQYFLRTSGQSFKRYPINVPINEQTTNNNNPTLLFCCC